MKKMIKYFSPFLLLAGGSFFAYKEAFFISTSKKKHPEDMLQGEEYDKVKDRMCEMISEMESVKGERVTIHAYDGKKLSGVYYHVKDGAPVHIQMHGYKGTAIRDFCGGNKLVREAGHNSIVVDQRAHGESDGHTITFGINERYDCVSWAQYVQKRFGKDTPVFLSGLSMGASTVLMAAGLDLPENVVGIIADCPFSSPEQIIRKVCTDRKIPHRLVFPLIRMGGKMFGRFDICETDVLEAVKKKKVPLLLFHGERDKFVPCDMSWQIYAAAAEPKRLEVFPETGHGLCYLNDTSRYEKIIREFTEFCLNEFQKSKVCAK